MFTNILKSRAPWKINKVIRNQLVAALGDSITTLGGTAKMLYLNAGYYTWFLTLPKTGDSVGEGQFQVGGIYGLTGQSIDQIKTTYLPQVLAANPRPGMCIVLAGTNNTHGWHLVPAYLPADLIKMESIYVQLLNAAILPICCGIPTIGVDNSMPDDRGVIPTFNAGVQALATKYDLPYYDFFPLTDDGDGWKDGWCGNPGAGDNHPSPTAAKAMGQALRDLLDPYAVSFSTANLVTDTTDTASDLLWQNGSMVDDGDADGKPDGGYVQASNGWYWPLHAQTVLSLEAEPGIVSGNWLKISRQVLKTQEEYVIEAAWNTHITAGMRIRLGFICKVLNAETAATFSLLFWDQAGTTILGLMVYSILGDTNVFKLYWDFIVPAGVTGARARLASTTAGLHDIYFGQYTIRQL